jgi:aspartate dehydrogenase
MTKIGLIGLGSIGKTVTKAIANGTAGQTQISAVLVRPTGLAKAADFLQSLDLTQVLVTSDLDRFLQVEANLVIEAAGQEAVCAYSKAVLSK